MRHASLHRLILGLGLGLIGSTCLATGTSFKDWAVVCDNTRHCEAVGAQTEDGDSPPVALWIARDAGPGSRAQGKLVVQTEDDAEIGALTLKIGTFRLRGLANEADLTPAQFDGLIARALEAGSAEIDDGTTRWVLSFAGLKAALLKIDEVQGRLGTAGAFVRRGHQPEASVPAAVPAPVVRAAKLPALPAPNEATLAAILAELRRTETDCFEDLPDDDAPDASIAALSATQVLVMRECWRAAYQTGAGAWIANAKPPYRPQRLRFPMPDGRDEDSVANAEYEDGLMDGYGKGRGLFDCGAGWRWVWTGTRFELIEAWIGPLCRGMAGGGTPLRAWTAQLTR